MLLAAGARPRYDGLQHKFGGCRGRRVAPSPACVPARRVTMPEGTPFIRSDASNRNADEPRPLARLQLHQHRAFAIHTGILDGIAHVDRVGDLLPTDIEDDVAGLEAVRGGEPAGVDVDHDHAFGAFARGLFGGSQHHAEFRHVGAGRGGLRHGSSALLRHLAERQRDALLRTLAPDRDIHRSAGCQTADLYGEVTGILDWIAVDGSDDIARLDADLGGGTIRHWFGNQRAFALLHAEAFGDGGGDRLNLDANPAAAACRALCGICCRDCRKYRVTERLRPYQQRADREIAGRGKKDEASRRKRASQFVSWGRHNAYISLWMARSAPVRGQIAAPALLGNCRGINTFSSVALRIGLLRIAAPAP